MNQLEAGKRLALFPVFLLVANLAAEEGMHALQHESATSTDSTALQVVKHIKYIDMATLEMTGMDVNMMQLRSIP
jgi:hypothetical protein